MRKCIRIGKTKRENLCTFSEIVWNENEMTTNQLEYYVPESVRTLRVLHEKVNENGQKCRNCEKLPHEEKGGGGEEVVDHA